MTRRRTSARYIARTRTERSTTCLRSAPGPATTRAPRCHSAASDDAPAYFSEVYRSYPNRTFHNMLVIGAGTGNDTSAALRHGVESIDAVDIDPAILKLGVERHPDRPYDDARVHRYVDDG